MEWTRPRWLVSGAADQARPATSLWPANTAAAGVVATSVSARRCRSVSHAAQVSTNPTARMASLASISMSAAPGPTFGSDALLAGPDDQRCGQVGHRVSPLGAEPVAGAVGLGLEEGVDPEVGPDRKGTRLN